jgi:hypothetical protein
MTADAAPPQGVRFPALEAGNDLGDEAVVELLVRGFIDRALDIFHAVARDERTLDDGVGEIGAQAETLNSLFLGASDMTGVILHPWNSPEQLGAYMRDAMGLDFPPEECVRAGLIHLATLMMHTIQGAPDNWQSEVETMRMEMRDLLLGRRPLSDDDGEADELPM